MHSSGSEVVAYPVEALDPVDPPPALRMDPALYLSGTTQIQGPAEGSRGRGGGWYGWGQRGLGESSRGIRISGAYVEAVVDPVSVGPVAYRAIA